MKFDHESWDFSEMKIRETKYKMYGSWDYSLFGCFGDFPVCLIGTFCPAVLYGQTQDIMKGLGCLVPCLLYTLMPCFRPCVGAANRSDVRAYAGGIHGSQCKDCGIHCFCSCCALIQEHRQALRVKLTKQNSPIASYVPSFPLIATPNTNLQYTQPAPGLC